MQTFFVLGLVPGTHIQITFLETLLTGLGFIGLIMLPKIVRFIVRLFWRLVAAVAAMRVAIFIRRYRLSA